MNFSLNSRYQTWIEKSMHINSFDIFAVIAILSQPINYISKNSETFLATRNSTIDFIFCIDIHLYRYYFSKLAKIKKIMYSYEIYALFLQLNQNVIWLNLAIMQQNSWRLRNNASISKHYFPYIFISLLNTKTF